MAHFNKAIMSANKPVATGLSGSWSLSAGTTSCIGCYQSKGASSYSASLLDLSGNHNDLTAGVDPTWDTVNGWTFGGSQYLITPLTGGPSYSAIVRFTSSNNSFINKYILGSVSTSGTQGGLLIEQATNTSHGAYRHGVNSFNTVSAQPTGDHVMAITSTGSCYMDGTSIGTLVVNWTGVTQVINYIGASNRAGVGAFNRMTGTIVAVAFYNTPPSDSQIAAISTAMAAL